MLESNGKTGNKKAWKHGWQNHNLYNPGAVRIGEHKQMTRYWSTLVLVFKERKVISVKRQPVRLTPASSKILQCVTEWLFMSPYIGGDNQYKPAGTANVLCSVSTSENHIIAGAQF